MPQARVIQYNAAIRLTFPPGAYLDTNFLVFARDRASPKYFTASSCLAELINQGIPLHVSSLMFDELWCAYLKISYRDATGNKLDAKTYKTNQNIWQRHWPAVDRITNEILGWNGINVLSAPADLTQRAQALINQNHLAPRDAFHVALALAHAIPCLITADPDFGNLTIPAGSSLDILKI